MFCRARHVLLAAALAAAPYAVSAQMQWQPTTAPLVTAENTTWFQSAVPIDWNGDVYYAAGAIQLFNPYQMVRSGSYRGIPLYIDATLEPYSIVFVPLSGGRMQPYERRRTGILAGTTGSRAPSLPTQVSTEAIAPPGGIAQAAAPPMLGPSYEIVSAPEPTGLVGTTPPPARTSVAAATEAGVVGTSGRTAAPARSSPVTSVIPPTGLNAIWIKFDGRRWYAEGKAIEYDASALEEIGTYQGWTVYRRKGDPSVIYVPSVPGLLSPYKRR
jgi:hypothetical protein